jgi:hypothetical protein
MTKTKQVLATLAFLVTLGSTACDQAGRDAPAQPARERLGPVAQAGDPAGGSCCGHFVDGDGDDACDLATSGECRKGRDGRCGCAGGCAGCF